MTFSNVINKLTIINKYLYESNIEHKSVSVRECVVFCLSLLHMLQDKDVRVDNSQKSKVLHDNSLGAHSQIFFQNNVRHNIF